MQLTSTQTFRTVGTRITECDTEKLPTEIIWKAVSLIDRFDFEICRAGLHAVHSFLVNEFPDKVDVLKDQLLIYLIKQTIYVI